MPELNELNQTCGPILYGRAEPDDEFNPKPEPLDPKLIDEFPYEDEDDEEDDQDENHYSS